MQQNWTTHLHVYPGILGNYGNTMSCLQHACFIDLASTSSWPVGVTQQWIHNNLSHLYHPKYTTISLSLSHTHTHTHAHVQRTRESSKSESYFPKEQLLEVEVYNMLTDLFCYIPVSLAPSLLACWFQPFCLLCLNRKEKKKYCNILTPCSIVITKKREEREGKRETKTERGKMALFKTDQGIGPCGASYSNND